MYPILSNKDLVTGIHLLEIGAPEVRKWPAPASLSSFDICATADAKKNERCADIPIAG